MSETIARFTKSRWFLPIVLALALLAAYANHFHNSFQFDDWHTVVDNPSIRSLKNLPHFLTDAGTFSVLPANRSWRPLVTTSLAIDYWIGKGANPFWFQLSTFLWYSVHIALVFLLFDHLFRYVRPDPSSRYLALFSAALYGLHPACAETVNYVNQRAEVYSTLGVVAGLYLYAARPDWRKSLLYLAPVVLAVLAKPPALIFPALLFAYIYLFEKQNALQALRITLPAIAVSAFLGLLQVAMTPSSYSPGAVSAYAYRITQPYVALRYFESFLLPLRLSADSDLKAASGIASPEAQAGFGFIFILILAAWYCSRRQELKPAAFGLWWFLIALVPVSLFPLAEVENDHRMFFPFVGLAMSAGWTLGLFWKRFEGRIPSWVPLTGAVALLVISGGGVYARNKVWRDELSLWRDVTLKSPGNGRGWMNYGTALMSKGDMNAALNCFRQASVLTPTYDLVEVNLGIATAALHRDAEAEQHFQRAVALAPRDAAPRFYYARWLHGNGRQEEAQRCVRVALALNPAQPGAKELLQVLGSGPSGVPADGSRTPEQWLNVSLEYYRDQRYMEAIAAAQTAVYLRPGYADAYNNVGAAYAALQLWEPAVQADLQAVHLKPDFQLAKNNLAWALSQRQTNKR